MEKQDFYTIKELQKLFKTSYPTLHKMVVEGRIKGIKFGSRWLIPAEELERIKEERIV